MKCQSTGKLLAHPEFSELDRHFAQLMERLAGGDSPAIALAAALVSKRVREGHTCFDLRQIKSHPVFRAMEAASPLAWPGMEEWMSALRASPVVGKAGEALPLVLDGAGRLYLHRYWECEQDVARGVRERCGGMVAIPNEQLLAASLAKYFPVILSKDTDWQQVAAETALRKRFTVISGGPGTGKTRTIGVVLALMVEQWPAARVALAAPTGKAAARLHESVKELAETLQLSQAVVAALPTEVQTLHRLLGVMPDRDGVRFDERNPLPFDTVIVDEASMVNLVMMAKLFRALRSDARLVLVGDKDQLASVEAGAVLGDIGAAADGGLGGVVVNLRKNFRSGAATELSALSAAVNAGEVEAVLELVRRNQVALPAPDSRGGGKASKGEIYELRNRAESQQQVELSLGEIIPPSSRPALVFRTSPAPSDLKIALRPAVLAEFGSMIRETDPGKALVAMRRFRILCALREGPFGVAHVNRLVEEILVEAGLVELGARWYAGQPVLVSRNDYSLRLFNGDLGVIMRGADGDMQACFAAADGSLRRFLPIRLPEHETVFALTVHKSQGSEFDKVLMVLPEVASPVLSRELLYTGLTRARESVEVWSGEDILTALVGTSVTRESGLREALCE